MPMSVKTNVHLFRQVPHGDWTFARVFDFEEDDLSPRARRAFAAWGQSGDPLHTLFSSSAWLLQAITEWQDLQGMEVPSTGRFASRNYLFYEGLAELREAVLAGCSGLFSASFATLRATLEMLVFHCWWRKRLVAAKSHEAFFDWLEGRVKSPPFKNVLADVYGPLSFPETARGQEECETLYEMLCEYSHKPLREFSITTIRGSNTPADAAGMWKYWMDGLHAWASCVLDLLIATHPEGLFDVGLLRRFGLNPPMGVFPDSSNLAVLTRALGDQKLAAYRSHHESNPDVQSLLEWAAQFPDKTDEEIIASWPPGERLPDLSGATDAGSKMDLLWAATKAQIRALNWMWAYKPGDLVPRTDHQ